MGRVIVILLCCILLGLVIYAIISYTHTTPVKKNPTPSPIASVLHESTGVCHARYIDANDPQAVLSDPTCTPGVLNPDVTQDNIQDTICKAGYTKTIRPPASYTSGLKRQQITDYGYSDTSMRSYEEDHLISLELGGAPSDPKNLWPEPHGSPNEKDKVENYLNEQVCNGTMSLSDAQAKIQTNWYEVYKFISH